MKTNNPEILLRISQNGDSIEIERSPNPGPVAQMLVNGLNGIPEGDILPLILLAGVWGYCVTNDIPFETLLDAMHREATFIKPKS